MQFSVLGDQRISACNFLYPSRSPRYFIYTASRDSLSLHEEQCTTIGWLTPLSTIRTGLFYVLRELFCLDWSIGRVLVWVSRNIPHNGILFFVSCLLIFLNSLSQLHGFLRLWVDVGCLKVVTSPRLRNIFGRLYPSVFSVFRISVFKYSVLYSENLYSTRQNLIHAFLAISRGRKSSFHGFTCF